MAYKAPNYFNLTNYLNTLTRQITPVQPFQEIIDNSIQYNSTDISVVFDADRDLAYIKDNGDGMNLETFMGSYHELNSVPNESSGISTYGVGSKVFVRLTTLRITLTRDKLSGECYYSILDASSGDTFANPHIDDMVDGIIPEILQPYSRLVKMFFLGKVGTMVILPNITDWPSTGKNRTGHVSCEKFRDTCFESFRKRYEHCIYSNREVNISVGLTKNDKTIFEAIEAQNIIDGTIFSKITDKTGDVEVVTYLTENIRTRQEITLVRNDIKFDRGCSFVRNPKRGSNPVSVGTPKYKMIRQTVFWKSKSDGLFSNIDPYKTSGALDWELLEICANEYSKITEHLDSQKITSTSPHSNIAPSELGIKCAQQIVKKYPKDKDIREFTTGFNNEIFNKTQTTNNNIGAQNDAI